MIFLKRTGVYIFLAIVAFCSVFPFIWMLIGATNSATDILKGRLLPGKELLENFSKLFSMANIETAFLNTSIIAIASTLLSLLITSLAGYGFEIHRSKIREKIYAALLLTMMIPFAAVMIPLYSMVSYLGLMDNLLAVVLPAIAVPFLIFLFRQNTKSFPQELLQAARIDGLNEIQAFFRIYVPTMKPTYAAAGIITFMGSWNNFLWPLIILHSDENKTLTLVISSLSSAYFPEYGVIMLAIVIATAPIIAVFFLLQKYFVSGILGSIK